MTGYVLAATMCATLSADSPVIKAADAGAVTNAVELLHRAAATLAAAEQAAADIAASARASGLQAAAAAVEEAVAAQLRAFAEALASERAQRREAVAQLAIGATQAVLGALPDDVLIRMLVNRALDQIDQDDIVEITIGPDNGHEGAREQLLADLAAQGIVARTDAALTRGDCVVATATGRIIASVDAQIAGIARRWGLESADER